MYYVTHNGTAYVLSAHGVTRLDSPEPMLCGVR